MKKLMSLMIGLGLILGTTAISFAKQDQPAPEQGKTKKKGKKKKNAEPKSGSESKAN